ncbi:TetR/AcrR family transcriptional regulator [Streptomyces sp. 6-11-2]|uniref:TetR/AcrR family transcriptional regulator n=1 Tax=Streptomyces sp. 6-11-2 TaxID=2585753 RepID=UPI001142312F|nr:TetR/AcrR family transcriptional regulator [Streptomyces sp. 6-11-2]GED90215.1 TetR family transcriptional regulator [Streptomyces sp. 6-11-2]
MREDRRLRRHNDTVREILDIALEVMAEEGVAALSMAEVARRMGMRPPSLYQYFPSRTAVYDALFERGMRETVDVLEPYRAMLSRDPRGALLAGQQATVAWAMAHPVLAQLLYWRPVPGFEPTPRAFEPAVRQLEILLAALQAAVRAGQLSPAAAEEDGVALFTALMAGVISQQLANEPSARVEEGRFTRLTRTTVDMFFHFYAPEEGECDDSDLRGGRTPAADRP